MLVHMETSGKVPGRPPRAKLAPRSGHLCSLSSSPLAGAFQLAWATAGKVSQLGLKIMCHFPLNMCIFPLSESVFQGLLALSECRCPDNTKHFPKGGPAVLRNCLNVLWKLTLQ